MHFYMHSYLLKNFILVKSGCYTLEGKLVAARRARYTAEEKLPSLATKAAAIDQQRVAVEEQCEHLVHELTLLNLRGSKLCMTINGAPPQTPIYMGLRFVAAHETKVVMRLSVHWAAVSLAAQSILE
jgi:hypothetical protein